MHWLRGATIGKIQSEIRIQTEDGKRINITQSLLRESIYIVYLIIEALAKSSLGLNRVLNSHFYESILTAFSVILIIDVLWALGKKRIALHDIISKTYCYQK